MPQSENHNDRNKTNVADRAFQRTNRPNQYVRCAVGDQDGGKDSRDYNDGESGNPDYYGDLSEGQVLLTENGDSSSPSELATDAIDVRNTDSDGEEYLANRSLSGEYRDAERAIGRGAIKTFEATNLARLVNGKRAIYTKDRTGAKEVPNEIHKVTAVKKQHERS